MPPTPSLLVGAVQPGLGHPLVVQLVHALPGLDHQIVVVAELDGSGRAGLGAGRGLAVPDPVVAERALLGDALVGHAGMFVARCVGGKRAVRTPFDDAERAAGHAGAAPVAHIGLHDDGAELGAEQRPGGAHVQAAGVRAVLAHVRRHQPAELGRCPAASTSHRGRQPRPSAPPGMPSPTSARPDSLACSMLSRPCSMNATCRQVLAPSEPVLSYEDPSSSRSPSRGMRFHSLQATSQALQPMQIEVSVKKPLRCPGCDQCGVARRVGRPAQLMRQSRLVRMARRMAR